MRAIRLAGTLLFAATALLSGCSVTVAPIVARDPQIACPGGELAWRLDISDQRAERKDSAKVLATLRDSITRSLPGCRWVGADAPAISIELHRFDVHPDENTWEAYAEWSVVARDRQGRTLTEFQADSQVSRPNFRGIDNEKAALQQALDEAMRRTLAGLRSVPAAG